MKIKQMYETIELNSIGDSRGELISLEALKSIPFEIKRVYYIFNVPQGISRGFHAHKELRQLMICMSGGCTIRLDNGSETTEVPLDSPKKALLLESGIWREMADFSKDCVLVVIADREYDESDYIRDYDSFLKYQKEKATLKAQRT